MHLHRQPVAMRVPEGAEMPQETRLLAVGQRLPDILQRGAQAVDDACHGVPLSSAISQAMRIAAASIETRFERGSPIFFGTTPLGACGRGNCPRREMTSAVPWKPSRRAASSTSTMVSPEPIKAICRAATISSGATLSNGASAPFVGWR